MNRKIALVAFLALAVFVFVLPITTAATQGAQYNPRGFNYVRDNGSGGNLQECFNGHITPIGEEH